MKKIRRKMKKVFAVMLLVVICVNNSLLCSAAEIESTEKTHLKS